MGYLSPIRHIIYLLSRASYWRRLEELSRGRIYSGFGKRKLKRKMRSGLNLMNLFSLPEMYFGEPVTTGGLVPKLREAYLKTKDRHI